MLSLIKIKNIQRYTLLVIIAIILPAATFTGINSKTLAVTYKDYQTRVILSDQLYNKCQSSCTTNDQTITKNLPFMAVVTNGYRSVNPPAGLHAFTAISALLVAVTTIMYVCLYVRSRYKLAAFAYWRN